MRHLAILCLVLGLAGTACGPRAEETAPPASPTATVPSPASSPPPPSPEAVSPVGSPSPGAASPSGSPAPSSPGAARPPSPQAARASRQALELLWTSGAQAFHAKALLKARQQDSAARDIQNAVVENLVKPSGKLLELQPISRDDFENPGRMLTVGIFPSPEIGELELDRYSTTLEETWWRLRTDGGEVLASLVVVPEQGGLKVQSLLLRAEKLGTPLAVEAQGDREEVQRILGLVQKGEADRLYSDVASPGLRKNVSSERLRTAVAQFRERLPEAALDPKLQEGRRWYSSEGWTRTYQYRLPGRQGELDVLVNLREQDRLLEGLTWSPAGGDRDDGGEL